MMETDAVSRRTRLTSWDPSDGSMGLSLVEEDLDRINYAITNSLVSGLVWRMRSELVLICRSFALFSPLNSLELDVLSLSLIHI